MTKQAMPEPGHELTKAQRYYADWLVLQRPYTMSAIGGRLA
jgi:hypothetical protein